MHNNPLASRVLTLRAGTCSSRSGCEFKFFFLPTHLLSVQTPVVGLEGDVMLAADVEAVCGNFLEAGGALIAE